MNKAYEIIEDRRIDDLNSQGTILRHKKTGARVVLLSNDDENKVFYIGFRTPPYDSTGLPHILEHSVLCGSKKYPVKDPFVELCKGSLNTFLNAMTYPDKTVYPLASCNDKDFQNIMDVYLDAVFHPNIYEREQIFRQEGWRYELENKEDEIKINGVVYNEMKGAFSSPEDMLEREIFNSLFPDTAYGVESGGDPDVIPELSYEKFLDFHSKYYHPSNSYIYLYGNMDMDEKLTYIDENYLSKYEKIDIDSSIKSQPSFTETKRIQKPYSITQDEPTENNTFLSYNVIVDRPLDKELYLAFQILDYVLSAAPGALITERLLKAGICQDVETIYENGILQPYYSIVGKGSDLDKEEEFLSAIKDELTKAVKEGLPKDMLLAGINVMEFKYREGDFGRYPKGLMYGLQALDSWLYDDEKPFMHIEANDTYAFLREKVNTDYFEKLIEDYLLNNNHASIVILNPEQGLTAKKDAELAEKLKEYKATLSDKELEKLIDDTKSLKEYQEEPSSQEDLEKIPLLQISDIKKEAKPFDIVENKVGNVTVITHENIFTNGIGYLDLYFDITDLDAKYLPYVGLLSNVLGYLDTKSSSYTDLTNRININTGGISAAPVISSDIEDTDKYYIKWKAKVKTLYSNVPVALSLMKEFLTEADYSDDERMLELLMMIKNRVQYSLVASGHSTAQKRVLSYFSEVDACREKLGGMEFYRLVTDLIDNYEARKEELKEILCKLTGHIFRKDNLMVNFTGSPSENQAVFNEIKKFTESLVNSDLLLSGARAEVIKKNEGFKTAAKVQYVAKAGNYLRAGLPYTGTLHVLKVIMGYDYLWNNVRVKGGAYGCMSGFSRSGVGYFVSYRDPNLKETVDIYDAAADYLSTFDASDRDMTKFIIGTFADIDAPLTPYDEGIRSFSAYYAHQTFESIQKSRDEIISCTVADIRKLSDYVRACMDFDCLCVVGGEETIEANKDMFDKVEDLL